VCPRTVPAGMSFSKYRSRWIHEYLMLLDNIEMFGLKPEGLVDYLSIFKYGCPPHGGFAIISRRCPIVANRTEYSRKRQSSPAG
jgi:aspartyl-tRNA synthetase